MTQTKSEAAVKPAPRVVAECWTCKTTWHRGDPLNLDDPCRDSVHIHPHLHAQGHPQKLTAVGAAGHRAAGHKVVNIAPHDEVKS